VHKRKLRSKLLQHGNRRRLVVHKHAPFARRENLAAQNDVVAFRVDSVLFKNGLGPGRGLKHAGNHGFFCPMAHHFR
jgi:hypothetical protein